MHIATSENQKLVNSAFCVGVYSILYLNYEPEVIYNILTDNNKTQFIGFLDASYPPNQHYRLKLKDCLLAIKKAKDLKFIDLDSFNVQEYEFYEKVKNGDLNFIIPNKILAFSRYSFFFNYNYKFIKITKFLNFLFLIYLKKKNISPHMRTELVNDYPRFSPNFYFNYFRKKNITTIIRLNEKKYDEKEFIGMI